MGIFNDILRHQRRKRKFRELSEDEERKKTSVSFGVRSIVNQIIGLALSLVGMIIMLSADDKSAFVVFIYLIFAALALSGFVLVLAGGWTNTAYQLRLNKKAVGKVALILNILSTAGTIIVPIIAIAA